MPCILCNDDGGFLEDSQWIVCMMCMPEPKKCIGCNGRGGWEDGDEGQWVVCMMCKNPFNKGLLPIQQELT